MTSFLRSLVLFAPFAFRKLRLHLIDNLLHLIIEGHELNGLNRPPLPLGGVGGGVVDGSIFTPSPREGWGGVPILLHNPHGLFHFILVVEVHFDVDAVATDIVEQRAQFVEGHPASHDALAGT